MPDWLTVVYDNYGGNCEHKYMSWLNIDHNNENQTKDPFTKSYVEGLPYVSIHRQLFYWKITQWKI